MCEYCGVFGQHNNIILELKNLHINPAQKYFKAIDSLTKALGYDSERQQQEVSPFKSVRDLEKLSKDRVEIHLLKLYNMIVSKWIGTEKAQTDPFVLSGRIFLNPKTGKPLTKKQWRVIKKEILKVFNYIYSFEEERIASHALALGKVLKGMSIKDSLSMGYKKLKPAVDDTMRKLEGPLWNNSVDFAQQYAGELIVDLKQSQYKKIHDTIQTAIKNRQSHVELKEELFNRFGEMNRDWRRIAETEIGNAQNNGQLITELERADEDETVFMRGVSSSGACPFCRGEVDGKVVVLLPEPPEEGDQVVIEGTTYTAIWPGKDNYGRRRADWWVSAGTQHPHCYSDDTEVLTENGFKYFRDVVKGEKIWSLNPNTETMELVDWVNHVDRQVDENLLHFQSRGVDLLVTDQHQMVYRTKKHRNIRFAPAKNLQKLYEFSIPSSVKWKGSFSKEYPTAIYSFFGWFLSEGSVCMRKNGACQLVISQSKKHTYYRNEIRKIFKQLNIKAFEGKNGFTVYGDFARWVNSFNFGHSSEKYIPKFIKDASKNDIVAFLTAFCKGDGTSRQRLIKGFKSIETNYYTSSKQLVDDICELILKIGQAPTVFLHSKKGTVTTHINGVYTQSHDVWRISVSRARNRNFRKDTKSRIVFKQYSGMVRCLELKKNHILCVRRNGKISWSGNCRCTWVKYVPGFEDIDAKFRASMEAAMQAGEKRQKPITDREKLIKPTPWEI